MAEKFYPEIVIGFVAPTGTDFARVAGAARDRLAFYKYDSQDVRLSEYLRELVEPSLLHPEDVRVRELQAVGDDLRYHSGHKDALGFAAAGLLKKARQERNRPLGQPASKQIGALAFLVWSFKHPAEVAAMRGIYGQRFFLISAYSPREARIRHLANRIRESAGDAGTAERFEEKARTLIAEDEYGGEKHRQNVRDTYPLADFFVDATPDTDEQLRTTVGRSIDLIFGHPFLTPTSDEFGMYVAQAASLQSSEMGRQVGSAIVGTGDILATGTNEVPAFGGGHYWPGGPGKDNRQFQRRFDESDARKRSLSLEVYRAFRKAKLVTESPEPTDAQVYDALEGTSLRGLTEYGRAVHAELAALTSAARRGVALAGSTMYVTTFPCHNCARHVVSAGIERLVYIDPYPKSRALDLHEDVIWQPDHPSTDTEDKVRFEPFLGVAPRQYRAVFASSEDDRKTSDGKAVSFDDPTRVPRLLDETEYGSLDVAAHIQREEQAVLHSEKWLEEAAEKVVKEREKARHGKQSRSVPEDGSGSPRRDEDPSRMDAHTAERADGLER